MPDTTNNTLLLNILDQMGDVRQDIGSIKAQLSHGATRHDDFDATLKVLEQRTAGLDIDMNQVVKPMAKNMKEVIEPKLKQHGQILGKVATVMGLASAAMTGAMYLIWYGIQHFGGVILDVLKGKGVS